MPMKFARWTLAILVVAVVAGAVASTQWTVRAQERGDARRPARGNAVPAPAPGPESVSVQEAMVRPFDLPFDQETTLEEVRQHLARALHAPVVLDRAALDLLELEPEDTVQLELKGVRLKVGLKLLLDQVGMSFRVVPEDNLLILTAPESADDPTERVLAEIKALHKEFHDLQDAVDDLRDLIEEDLGIEPEPSKHHSAVVRWKAPSRARERARDHRRTVAPAREGI
jgi:hypothetical protein